MIMAENINLHEELGHVQTNQLFAIGFNASLCFFQCVWIYKFKCPAKIVMISLKNNYNTYTLQWTIFDMYYSPILRQEIEFRIYLGATSATNVCSL